MRIIFCMFFHLLLLTNASHHWVLLSVDQYGSSILLDSRPLEGVRTDETIICDPEHKTHIYMHRNGKTTCSRSIADPHSLIYESLDENNKFIGGIKQLNSSQIAVVVPEDTTYLTVMHHGDVRRHATLHLKAFIESRKAIPQQTTSNAEVLSDKGRSMAGPPDKHKTIVLLAAGYKDSERNLFESAVNLVIHFLFGEMKLSDGPKVSPWDRYAALVNIQAVWQASLDSGASYPLGPDGNSRHSSGKEIIKRNNLDCKYGTEEVRLLNCDRGKMAKLASVASAYPGTTTIMALVNDAEYGGTAGARMGSIYAGNWDSCSSDVLPCSLGFKPASGNKFIQVFLHELGHADSDLMDEYSYNLEEKSKITTQNCYWSADGELPWKEWVDRKELGDPSKVCSYDNYYKPTPGRCLMENIDSKELCVVCAESQTMSIIRETKELIGQRCPRDKEEMVVLLNNEDNYLSVSPKSLQGAPKELKQVLISNGWDGGYPSDNPRVDNTLTGKKMLPLRQDDGDIIHMWQFPSALKKSPVMGTRTSIVSSVSFKGTDLGVGLHTFQFTVIDQTQYISDQTKKAKSNDLGIKNLNQTSTFLVRVVEASSSDWKHCTRDQLDTNGGQWYKNASRKVNQCPITGQGASNYYCGICPANTICNDSYPARAIDAQADFESVFQSVESLAMAITIPLVILSLILFLVMVGILVKHSQSNYQEILPYSQGLIIARKCMLGIQFLLMLTAVALIILAAAMYYKLTAFGKSAVLAGIIVACFLYLVSYLGFIAAWYRKKGLLIFAAIVLSLVAAAFIAIAIASLYIAANINGSSYTNQMADSWLSTVKDNPKKLCRFQYEAKCSGFRMACHVKLHSECPSNCDNTNAGNPNPCQKTIVNEVKRVCYPFGVVVIILGMVMLTGSILNWLLAFLVHKRLVHIKKRLGEQVIEVEVEVEEGEKVEGEITTSPVETDEPKKKVKKTKIVPTNATNTQVPRPVTILRSLTPTERELMIKEFQRLDKATKNKLDANGLCKLYKGCLGVIITVDEAKEAMAMCDTDSDNMVDINEFTSLYQDKEKIQQLKEPIANDPRLASVNPSTIDTIFKAFVRVDSNSKGLIPMTKFPEVLSIALNRNPPENVVRDILRRRYGSYDDDSKMISCVDCVELYMEYVESYASSSNEPVKYINVG